jgi:hypothetical protein
MGKVSKTSKRGPQQRKLVGVAQVVAEGKAAWRAFVQTADGKLVQLGVYSRSQDAAKATDLATLALGRRGPLNFLKNIYLQRDVEKEKERLRQLQVLPRERRKAAVQDQADQQNQQQQPANSKGRHSKRRKPAGEQQQQHAEPQAVMLPAADTAVADSEPTARSRKRKGLPQPASPATAAAEQDRPKRRKVKHTADVDAAAATTAADTAPAGDQPGPASTALVLAGPVAARTAGVLPIGAAAQFGSSQGDAEQDMIMAQLHSALAAHARAKQQLRAAQESLEVSEGQLAAVVRAVGLQLQAAT